MKHALASCALIALAAPAAAQTFERGERNTDFQPAFNEQFRAPLVESDVALATEEVAGDLVHPWGIDVLPEDGGYLVTERPGRLRHVAEDGTLSDPIAGVPEVLAERQGGLLDVKVAPDFADSRRIYMTYAKPLEDNLSATAAAYATLSEDMTELTDVTEIFVQAPGSTAPMHYGSRVVFDGEGHVFITTGEHSTQQYREFAQDLDKTYGKVIRLTLDGEVPEDNPFVDDEEAVDSIWSYGHRNMQGATMIDGELWTIEHGPQGGDELNLTEPGLNYGWPVVSYGEQYGGGIIGSGNASAEGMQEPVYFWDPVIAPGDMTVYEGEMFPEWEGDLLIGALVRGGLVRLSLEDGMVTEEESLVRDLGRVRDVTVDDDGSILAITDFENGQIVRITPAETDS
ncbi:PQQ-dependent sugar dehydrogenase [Allosediminivita pacifica]|uniref:Glucose/arabinose dehydrogenase n=1 Tax=Allosediminivita pacifica TaxID=1267769 RepID=A0A2T6AYA8_9RHOB|nr:PQQ-dependent sugar dehydrogenase [Allosediminivita pacifica]PTX48798.1 glucose/arabinose dehydrogenase [Allosediminivita pacifica]GGB08302.1 glucose dehydrogenase [Allosediminivita pacifica]